MIKIKEMDEDELIITHKELAYLKEECRPTTRFFQLIENSAFSEHDR